MRTSKRPASTFSAQQANLSISKRNVVRGLHYSMAPEGQAKVVTCAHGELDDVIVDIRVGSPTFGRHEVVHLAADEERSVYVPAGVAHGFCVTSEVGALVVSPLVALQRGARTRDQSLRRRDQRPVGRERRGDRESQGRRRAVASPTPRGERTASLSLTRLGLGRRRAALLALTR